MVLVLAFILLLEGGLYSKISVLVALPLHELLPEESVATVLVEAIGAKDLREVIRHGVVLLLALTLLAITFLHLLDKLLEHLGVLLGEVRLLLASLLVTHGVVDGAEGDWLMNSCNAHKSGLYKRD